MGSIRKTRLLILGSTGSIGSQALDVVRQFSARFDVVGVSVRRNIEKLRQQIAEFSVSFAHIDNPALAEQLRHDFPHIVFFSGTEGVCDLISACDPDLTLLAFVGESGVLPAKKVLEQGGDLALATKEVMVIAGEQVMEIARKNDCRILPVDSEHSAIWQCLRSGRGSEVSRIWLTCSGGPFRDVQEWPLNRFDTITREQALAHPNWQMGQKISIDSATLMNKAFELIETVRFFNVPHQDITVVIHPESFLHSAVEFCDGSVIGQIGTADMRTPIASALFYPERPPLPFPKFDFFEKQFRFFPVDEDRFPSIRFARVALEKNRCVEMNRANDFAVERFLQNKISFFEIFQAVADSIGEKV